MSEEREEAGAISAEDKVVADLLTRSEEPPSGPGLWVAAFFLGLLMAGAFYLTGMWLSFGVGQARELGGGVAMGFVPGMVSGAVVAGFVASVDPRVLRRALVMSLLSHIAPLVLLPPAFGVINFYAMVLAPMGALVGTLLAPKVVIGYRRRGWGKTKGPKGGWEERF